MSAAACAQYCARTFALPRPESRPISSFPAAGLLFRGVLMPMEVGVFRNCCWYAFAAATPELALPVEDPVGDPVALLPLVVVLLLLHAAMVNAEIPAMTNVRVFLMTRPLPGTRSDAPSNRSLKLNNG